MDDPRAATSHSTELGGSDDAGQGMLARALELARRSLLDSRSGDEGGTRDDASDALQECLDELAESAEPYEAGSWQEAVRLCGAGGDDAARRLVGAALLGRLAALEQDAGEEEDGEGDESRAAKDEREGLAPPTAPGELWNLLADNAPEVVAAALLALGEFDVDDDLSRLAPFAKDQRAAIRRALAKALAGSEDDLGIDLLIGLSEDTDAEVRDWATFGLGSLCERDDAALRAALRARLDDAEPSVRGEALLGLARRGDDVSEALELELRGDEVGALAVEAAEVLADPGLLPALRELEEWWDPADEVLARAIASCRAAARRGR